MRESMNEIIWAVVWFAGLSAVIGTGLALASRFLSVKTDERVTSIQKLLPGANCGGCGYPGCASLADAIVKMEAPVDACKAQGAAENEKIAQLMGVTLNGDPARFRAQVMCSGTYELASRKYRYEGISDCVAANRLAGGDKRCPNGCIGLGSCAAACKFDAIHIVNGVAAVDYGKCRACGECVDICPKHIIRLIPFDAKHWVGCMSRDRGPVTKGYCDVGCIGCKLCEKACPASAIHVKEYVAEIDYSLCTGCGMCEQVCPRKVIWSNVAQARDGIVRIQSDLDS